MFHGIHIEFGCKGLAVATFLVTNLSVETCSFRVLQALRNGLQGGEYDVWVVGGQQFTTCVDQVLVETSNSSLKIIQLVGVNAGERVAVLTPSMYQARYLHGKLCAQATKSRMVGFVTSYPFSNTVLSQNLNAFILGVKSYDPGISVVVGVTGSFLNPVAERKAAEILLDANVDCIAQQQNGLTVNMVADEAKIWSMGYVTDARVFSGSERVISSVQLDWGHSVLNITRSLINGTWIPNLYLEQGYASGTVGLSGYSTLMPTEWRTVIDETILLFENESLNVFCTPNFSDPRYFSNPAHIYSPSPNVTCLNPLGVSRMLGIMAETQILVDFTTRSPYNILVMRWTMPGVIVLVVFLGLVILAAIGSMVDVIVQRKTPIYRASSPLFCILILTGILICAIAPLFMIGERSKCSCMAPWWLLGVGHALIFSCLMAKNWRIWRIFNSGHFKVVAIMDTQLLFRWVGGIVSLEIIILTLWTIFDPQLPQVVVNPELKYDEKQQMCFSKSGKSIGLSTHLAYSIAVLIPLTFLSYLTRAAREEYRESRAIAMTVLTSVIVHLVAIGVLIAMPSDFQIYFYIFTFGVLLLLVVIEITFFLPKVWSTHFPSSSGVSDPANSASQGISFLQSQSPPHSMTGFETYRSGHGSRNVDPSNSFGGA